MALGTYADLKVSIIDHLERSDLADHVKDFIVIAESRHAREIRIRDMLQRSTLSISLGDQYIDLPADFLDLKYLRVQVPTTTSGRSFIRDLMQVNIHELTQHSVKDSACPRRFAVHSQIELDTIADQAYTGEIFYYASIDALSDSNTSNELLAKAPDVYLYASLSAAAPFLMHDERIPVWESLYQAARDGLNRSEQENRRGGPLVSRVSM